MKKITSILFSCGLSIFAVVGIISLAEYSVLPKDVVAQTGSTSSGTTKLSGYAWSENIGWISFTDGSKPVIKSADGSLDGYAWSEHIGWIQFGGLSGFPVSSLGGNAKLTGTTLSGWARAVSGFPPTSSDNRGGWDGWISLNNVNISASPSSSFTPSCKGGCAWGSDVVGWVDFAGVSTVIEKQSCIGSYGTIVPDGSNFTFFSAPDPDAGGVCGTQVKTCSNGVLSPNSSQYTEISCPSTVKSDCSRGGKTFKDGDKVVFFAKPIAGAGARCESMRADLVCQNGNFVDEDGNVDNLHKNLRCINNPSFIEQ